MIRYLIWDVDGTLFDTYPAINRAFGRALAALGASAPAGWVERLTKTSMEECLSTLSATFELDQEGLLAEFRAQHRAMPRKEQRPFPGVAAVCERVLADDGANVAVTHRGRESTLALLAAHDMERYFVDVIAGDEGYPRKPDPAAFETLIARHGFRRAETLAIGDRALDVLAGQAAGVRTCLFGPPLEGITADIRIEDYAELDRLIAAENRA